MSTCSKRAFQGIVVWSAIFALICHLCACAHAHVYFQSMFRIQNFQHSDICHLLYTAVCVFLGNSQNNSMHARSQNMRSDWKYTYWKDGHFLNAEILNSENWLKIHIHSKSTWSFGPLSSFGPVMVIRTPIRKDPRADSLTERDGPRWRCLSRLSRIDERTLTGSQTVIFMLKSGKLPSSF